MLSNVKYTDTAKSSNPAAVQTTARYDSGWVQANNSTDNVLAFSHNLGVAPTNLTIWFSPDQEDCYPLTWSWQMGYSGNPVTIKLNGNTVSLAIYSGAPLHGAWNPLTIWTNWSTGYFRVFASP